MDSIRLNINNNEQSFAHHLFIRDNKSLLLEMKRKSREPCQTVAKLEIK